MLRWTDQTQPTCPARQFTKKYGIEAGSLSSRKTTTPRPTWTPTITSTPEPYFALSEQVLRCETDAGRAGVLRVTVLDALTYAGNLESLVDIEAVAGYRFVQGDIADAGLIEGLLRDFRPNAVVNFAAESHVDRSIDGPRDFVETNINGTANLLEAARATALSATTSSMKKNRSRFASPPRSRFQT